MTSGGNQTLYQFAFEQMSAIVAQLLDLADLTGNFQTYPQGAHASDESVARLLLAGRGFDVARLPPPGEWPTLWLSRAALPFNVEQAAKEEIYARVEPFVHALISSAYSESGNFAHVTPEWIRQNPHLLPVAMHAAGSFSKQEFARRVGSAKDTMISVPASRRIASEFARVGAAGVPDEARVRERMKATTEGIVRDLVGRLLLEQLVAKALKRAGVDALRESDYESLPGVVYDFRADFVIPDAVAPRAFIEVRKSSQRHASLYAKDKMFSAINWKGRHRDAIGVLVVDGPWTAATLNVLAQVFDYVIPVGQVAEVARRIREYLDGDRTALRWMVTFQIDRAESVPREEIG